MIARELRLDFLNSERIEETVAAQCGGRPPRLPVFANRSIMDAEDPRYVKGGSDGSKCAVQVVHFFPTKVYSRIDREHVDAKKARISAGP